MYIYTHINICAVHVERQMSIHHMVLFYGSLQGLITGDLGVREF